MKKIKNNVLLMIIFLSITKIHGSQSPSQKYSLDQSAINTFISDSLVFTPQEHLKKITLGYLGETPAIQLKKISTACQAYANILTTISIMRQEIFKAKTQARINNIVLSVIEDIDANYQLYKKSKK